MITEQLGGKTIFITGVTGFVGKALLRNLLELPVHKVYILVRLSAQTPWPARLEKEFERDDLFSTDRLRRQLRDKVVPVSGALDQEDLGIAPILLHQLRATVQVVLHVAADTNLCPMVNKAVEVNTIGSIRVVELAASCSHLQLLLHCSTAYVQSMFSGVVKEASFTWAMMADAFNRNFPKVMASCDPSMWQLLAHRTACLEEELAWALQAAPQAAREQQQKQQQNANEAAQGAASTRAFLQRAAELRARLFGQPSGYAYSKVLAEMAVEQVASRRHVPLVIMRPAIITPTTQEGWVANVAEISPLIMGYLRGEIDGVTAIDDRPIDFIPCDFVVHAMIAAVARHARAGCSGQHSNASPAVYNIASSVLNPCPGQLMSRALTAFGRRFYPERNLPNCESLSLESFRAMVLSRYQAEWRKVQALQEVPAEAYKHLQSCCKRYHYNLKYVAATSPYVLSPTAFDASNTAELFTLLTAEEQQMWPFDIKGLDWDFYCSHAYFPGVSCYLLKDGKFGSRAGTVSVAGNVITNGSKL